MMNSIKKKNLLLTAALLCASQSLFAVTIEEAFSVPDGVTVSVTNDVRNPWTVTESSELYSYVSGDGYWTWNPETGTEEWIDNVTSITFHNESGKALFAAFSWKKDEMNSLYCVTNTGDTKYCNYDWEYYGNYSSESIIIAIDGSLTFRNCPMDGSARIKDLAFYIATPEMEAGANHSDTFTDANGSTWGYHINALGTGATITSYSGSDFMIIVPESIEYNGYTFPIDAIGANVFQNNTNISSVILPNSIKQIGNYVFDGCNNLRTVSIPELTTSIGHYAFRGCNNISSIELPDNITYVGEGVFYESGITAVTIPSRLNSIPNNAFHYCM